MLVVTFAQVLVPATRRAFRRLGMAALAALLSGLDAFASAQAGLFTSAEAAEAIPPFH